MTQEERFQALKVGDVVYRRTLRKEKSKRKVVCIFNNDKEGRQIVVRRWSGSNSYGYTFEVINFIAFEYGPWRFSNEKDDKKTT